MRILVAFLLTSIAFAQTNFNMTRGVVLASWLKVSDEYDGYGNYYEQSMFRYQASIFADEMFEKKNLNLNGWLVKQKANYSYEAIQRELQKVQIAQYPNVFDYIYTSIFYFLEKGNERLVIHVNRSSLTIYFPPSQVTGKDYFISEFKNFSDNLSPYIGSVLEQKIEGDIDFFEGTERLDASWEKFIFPFEDKAVVEESFSSFLKNYNEQEWDEYGLPLNKGVLLYGPPGTGKSYIASILATNVMKKNYVEKTTYIHVQSRHINRPTSIRSIFNAARIYSPSVVFFEDIDLIAGTDRAVKPKVKNELMQQLSGLESLDGVLTVGTTNSFDTIDSALKRSKRLGYHYEIGMPGLEERKGLLDLYLGKHRGDFDTIEFAAASEGMTGADLKDIVEMSYLEMKRNQENSISHGNLRESMNLKKELKVRQ